MPQQAWLSRTLGFLTFWLVTSSFGVGALPSYTLTDLGPCEVRGMSQEGVAVIVGDCNNVATVLYPYTRELGVITPGGIGSTAEGTAWRYVVGSSSAGTNGGPTHSFVWTLAGGLHDLGTTGASTLSSVAVDVNVGGFIVGYGDHATQDRIIALLWCCDGGVFPLQDLHPRTRSRALSINRWGDVVGTATTPEGVLHPILWGGRGGMWDLHAGSATPGVAVGINTWRMVVGWHVPPGGARAFLWTEERGRQTLPPLGDDTTSFAFALNDWGVPVGMSVREGPQASLSSTAAVLWSGDTPMALAELVQPEPDWTLVSALAINNAGMITGMGLHHGQRRGYLLTPTGDTIARTSSTPRAQAETHGPVLRVLLPRGSGKWVP